MFDEKNKENVLRKTVNGSPAKPTTGNIVNVVNGIEENQSINQLDGLVTKLLVPTILPIEQLHELQNEYFQQDNTSTIAHLIFLRSSY